MAIEFVDLPSYIEMVYLSSSFFCKRLPEGTKETLRQSDRFLVPIWRPELNQFQEITNWFSLGDEFASPNHHFLYRDIKR